MAAPSMFTNHLSGERFIGRVIGASKVARDITEQKQAEQALRESEQLFRVVTDASPIMVWLSGTDKLCDYFNKGWLDFVGRTLEQESGNGWAENLHLAILLRRLQIYVSNFDARRPSEMEYRMRHHTGQYRWEHRSRSANAYAPDGTFEGYVVVASTSTTRKRRQRRFGLPMTWRA